MLRDDPSYFDIDVDLSPILGTDRPLLMSHRWYQLLSSSVGRPLLAQRELEAAFRDEIHHCERLARFESADRRQTLRAPILSRVQVERGSRLVATNVSSMGLCCSGRPTSGLLDIEFKLPGLDFPVAARAEVASFVDRPVIPLVGLRFVDIDRPYIESITRYVDTRRLQCSAD